MKVKRILVNPYDSSPAILEAILEANRIGLKGHKLEEVVTNIIPFGRGNIELYFSDAEEPNYLEHGQGD